MRVREECAIWQIHALNERALIHDKSCCVGLLRRGCPPKRVAGGEEMSPHFPDAHHWFVQSRWRHVRNGCIRKVRVLVEAVSPRDIPIRVELIDESCIGSPEQETTLERLVSCGRNGSRNRTAEHPGEISPQVEADCHRSMPIRLGEVEYVRIGWTETHDITALMRGRPSQRRANTWEVTPYPPEAEFRLDFAARWHEVDRIRGQPCISVEGELPYSPTCLPEIHPDVTGIGAPDHKSALELLVRHRNRNQRCGHVNRAGRHPQHLPDEDQIDIADAVSGGKG